VAIQVSITSHNNNDPMGATVSGGVAVAVFMPAPKPPGPEFGSEPPPPNPDPDPVILAVPVVTVTFQRTDAVAAPKTVVATVTGMMSPWSWTANVPGDLTNGTYLLLAIAVYDTPLPTSTTRTGIHKP
jgi:hypothetical protein